MGPAATPLIGRYAFTTRLIAQVQRLAAALDVEGEIGVLNPLEAVLREGVQDFVAFPETGLCRVRPRFPGRARPWISQGDSDRSQGRTAATYAWCDGTRGRTHWKEG